MVISADQFKSTALVYINRLNGGSLQLNEIITESLIKNISTLNLKELPKQDLELLINQFFNLIYFGPISHLEIFITENCNLACDYCFVRKKHNKKMLFDTIVSAINFLVFYSGNEKNLNLTLFGGEPLLEKETIYKVLNYCEKIKNDSKTKEFNISITTNGTLIDKGFLKRTKGKIDYLLSIDGAEDTHDLFRKYKNGKGTFKTIISKIQLLKKYQPWIGARMTIMPDSTPNLYNNVTYLYNAGVNQFLLGPAMDVDWDENALRNYEIQLKKVSQFYLEKRQANEPLRMTLFEKNEKDIDCHKHQWGCGAGINTISVNTSGDIYPCSKFLGYEDFNCHELKLGNLHEGITNIDLRFKMSRLTNESFPTCNSCKEINACRGGCPADNYYLNRDLNKAGKAHCELKKIENRILRNVHQQLGNEKMNLD